MRKDVLAIIAVCGLSIGLARAGDEGHFIDKGAVSEGAVPLNSFDMRIENDGVAMQQNYHATASRFVEYDSAFPRDEAEYRTFGKYGIVLVSAMTQNESELPLARVYVLLGGQEIVLRRVASVRRELPEGGTARTEFGPHREDSFYLLPIKLKQANAALLCDFAANRKAFDVGTLEGGLQDFIASDPDKEPGEPPSEKAIRAFIDREYPGFLSKDDLIRLEP